MNNYLVIADDFTGANDTGVQIRRRGIPVSVVFSGRGVTGRESCVLDTESRALSGEDAFQKTVREAGGIPFAEFSRIIKKTDSTLRGNTGAETRAIDICCADQRCKPELIVFAPAFPALGRTTVNRIHCLNGTPVSQTELAKDPKTPVRNDDIQKIMADAFPGEKVTHTGLDALRAGSFSLEGGRIFCFDAAADTDLQIIVKAVLQTKKRVLWVGAAALADSLLAMEHPLPPALAVVASLSSVSRGQVLYAEKQGITLVKVPLGAALGNRAVPEASAEEAAALLNGGKDVVLLPSSTYSDSGYKAAEESARAAGLSTGEMSAFTQETMGRITALVLEKAEISGLFLSGGDTAVSCFESLGSVGSSIITEVALGIPLMRLTGGKYGGLKVVTKAGAFGKEDAVFYALRKLREIE